MEQESKRFVKNLINNLTVKNVLSAVAVAIFGLILLNVAFIFDAVYQGSVRWVIAHFIDIGPDMRLYWFPPLMHLSFVVIIGVISWFVFRSKLGEIYKAIYLVVPVAVVLVTVGMFLFHWPIAGYSVGFLLCACTLYYFYRTKQPWLYYYSVILIGLALAIFTLMGGEI
jgi:hypothetical protein